MNMDNSYEVTVLIPNFNGLKFLKPCIKSLEDIKDEKFDLLVVDNGSDDGSKEWMKEKKVRFIDLDKNYGFAGGVNRGLKEVKTKYVILLNNDTVVRKNYVSALLSTIKSDDKIFAVSPMMINAHDDKLIDDAGDGLTLVGWGYQRGVGENIKYYEKAARVFSACGGASIYNMDILNEIGYFDEEFFAYLEDIDLSYRAALHGYYVLYEPASKVLHLGSATSGSRYNSFKVKLAARNNIYLFYKNQTDLQLVINFIPMFIGHVIKILFFLKKGYAKDYISGIKEGINKHNKVKREVYSYRVDRMNLIKIELLLFFSCFDYIKHFIFRRIRK